MDFDFYQKECAKTDVGTAYKDCISPGFLYYILGIGGEAGELLEKVKKLFRDKNGVIDDEFLELITKELGDIQWYSARLADYFNIKLSTVAESNLKKLQSRMDRDLIHGDGDNR